MHLVPREVDLDVTCEIGLGDTREVDLVPGDLGFMILETREVDLEPECYLLCYYLSDGVLMSSVDYQSTCSVFKGKMSFMTYGRMPIPLGVTWELNDLCLLVEYLSRLMLLEILMTYSSRWNTNFSVECLSPVSIFFTPYLSYRVSIAIFSCALDKSTRGDVE